MPLKNLPDMLAMQRNYNTFKAKLPQFVGSTAVSFFKDNFKRQGFLEDTGTKKWQDRKTKEKGRRRAILIKSGALRRSVQVKKAGYSANKIYVIVGSDMPYAQIHNQGGIINTTQQVRQHSRRTKTKIATVKAHQRNVNTTIPQRQFAGDRLRLHKTIKYHIFKKLKHILTF